MPVRPREQSPAARSRRSRRWRALYIRYGWVSLVLLPLVLALLAFVLWQRRYAVYDLVIENGKVFDGERMLRWGNGVAIRRGRIENIGFGHGLRARERVNAWRCIVAPGFIDTHVHVERSIVLGQPFRAPNFVRMGVTTVITGNCGTSAKDIRILLSQVDASGGHVNVATLVGHNTIREAVMEGSRGEPAAKDLQAMAQMVDRAMRDGAFGVSSGFEYAPGAFAGEDEVVTLAGVASRWGGIYATHLRNEGLGFAESLDEALRTARRADIPLHISHMKITCPRKWGEMSQALKKLASARDGGQRVTQDVYVYSASSTSLDLLLPVEYRGRAPDAGTVLQDPERRKQLAYGMVTKLRQEGFPDYGHARVAYFRDPFLKGKSIPEIVKILPSIRKDGTWRQPWLSSVVSSPELRGQLEAVPYLYSQGGAQMIYFVMDESDIEALLKDSNTMIGSDSAVRSSEQTTSHPRGSGNCARVLGTYVGQRRVLSWEDALQRMTSLPAETFRIQNRGKIKKGYAAEVVVFDPERIRDRAWYDRPLDSPSGIDYVIVNGQIVLRNGELRQVFLGRALRLRRTWQPRTPAQAESRIALSIGTPSGPTREAAARNVQANREAGRPKVGRSNPRSAKSSYTKANSR